MTQFTDGIIAHDEDRRILCFNKAAEEITGYRASEVLGRDCHAVFHGNFCGGKCLFCDPVSPNFDSRKQDLELTTTAACETNSVNVLGASGNPKTLNKVDMVRLTQFTVAANDTAAASAGVNVGEIYYNSTNSKLHARMS